MALGCRRPGFGGRGEGKRLDRAAGIFLCRRSIRRLGQPHIYLGPDVRGVSNSGEIPSAGRRIAKISDHLRPWRITHGRRLAGHARRPSRLGGFLPDARLARLRCRSAGARQITVSRGVWTAAPPHDGKGRRRSMVCIGKRESGDPVAAGFLAYAVARHGPARRRDLRSVLRALDARHRQPGRLHGESLAGVDRQDWSLDPDRAFAAGARNVASRQYATRARQGHGGR